jgi:SAM-dependent methyltransferase
MARVPEPSRSPQPATHPPRRGQPRVVFNTLDAVAAYEPLGRLAPAEAVLFGRHLPPGADVLDLGVGTGRTTAHLSLVAGRYVGMDIADRMIEVCRARHPGLEFLVGDASDLSIFADGSFDAVVFSFNGIDCLPSDEHRRRFLRECHRVLRAGGTFVFSTHNPRVLASMPASVAGLRPEAPTMSAGRREIPDRARTLRWAGRQVFRLACHVGSRAFWRGEGWVLDSVHGDRMHMHEAIPRAVVRELALHGFDLLEMIEANHPKRLGSWLTPWYHSAFSRAPAGEGAAGA